MKITRFGLWMILPVVLLSCKPRQSGSDVQEFETSEDFCGDVKKAVAARWQDQYGDPMEYYAGFLNTEKTAIRLCLKKVENLLQAGGKPSTRAPAPKDPMYVDDTETASMDVSTMALNDESRNEQIPQDNSSERQSDSAAPGPHGAGCDIPQDASREQLSNLVVRMQKNLEMASGDHEQCQYSLYEFCGNFPSNKPLRCVGIDAAKASVKAISQAAKQLSEMFEKNYVDPVRFLADQGQVKELCGAVKDLRAQNPTLDIGTEVINFQCDAIQTKEAALEYMAGLPEAARQNLASLKQAAAKKSVDVAMATLERARAVGANLKSFYDAQAKKVSTFYTEVGEGLATEYSKWTENGSWTNNNGVSMARRDGQGRTVRDCCECQKKFYWDTSWVMYDTEDPQARKLWRSVAQKGDEDSGNCMFPGGSKMGHRFENGKKYYRNKIYPYYYVYDGCRKTVVNGETCALAQ